MTNYRSIRILPDNVANKIAAGEVVERPASVVKELVENSLDSGAVKIEINVAAGGRKLVSVADNGRGMDRDNALLAIERHATSKIQDVDDIENISTLGFRGEAIPAIASVSRFRMTSNHREDQPGTEISISGGKLQDVKEIGWPIGTKIEVRNLFFNVPARRKFLRTYKTEFSHIKTTFIVQAIANPSVSLSLTADNKPVYNLAPASLKERLLDLMGADYLKKLRPVEAEQPQIRITGFASTPAMNRPDRNEQYVFVNGRAVKSALTSRCITEAYHGTLPGNRHPSVFLFIEVDPESVDVNVHPTKREIRFRRPSEVRDTVIGAIQKALNVTSGQSNDPRTGQDYFNARAVPEASLNIDDLPQMRSFRYPGLDHMNQFRKQGRDGNEPDIAPSGNVQPEERQGDIKGSPWSWCRVLGQIGGLYVVMETEDGLVLMDPHAAHERILFERFMRDALSGSVQSQRLLMPETVNLSAGDARQVRKNLQLFQQMGFGIAEFGEDTFVVDSLPSYFSATSPRRILPETADTLERAGKKAGEKRWREEAIAQAACKAAVKARDRLSLAEIEQLVIDLAKAEMPYTCPHGRPTIILTSFQDLNRKFGRL
ncbi:MAG: DNA mismatch repair endonuclease MutL [Verrucomicrobiota bacterium]